MKSCHGFTWSIVRMDCCSFLCSVILVSVGSFSFVFLGGGGGGGDVYAALVASEGADRCQHFLAINEQLRWFASSQIRNGAAP